MRSMYCTPGKIFPWWFTFDRQMRAIFACAGAVAELRVLAATIVALREAGRRASHKPRPRTYGSVRGANIADVVGATLHDGRNIVLRLCGRHRPGAPQQGGQGAFQGSVGRHELSRPLLRPLMAAKTAHRDGASQISWTRSDFDPSIEEPPGGFPA